MANLNKCFIMGNVASDIDNRSFKTGITIAAFTVAINEKAKTGNVTTYVNIKTFGKTAEVCCSYIRKGQTVMVEGKYRQDVWDDKKTGTKKYFNYILAENIQFFNSAKTEQQEYEEINTAPNTQQNNTSYSKYPPADFSNPPDNMNNDDEEIPF